MFSLILKISRYLYRFVSTYNEINYDKSKTKQLNARPKDDLRSKILLEIIKARKKFQPPKLVAVVYCSRKPAFYIFNAFSLIFCITLISFTVFEEAVGMHYRLKSMFTILLAAVSLKWTVLKKVPPISYLTLLDVYQVGSLIFICLVISWHALGAQFFPDGSYDKLFMYLYFSLFFLSHLFLVCYVYGINVKRRILTMKERHFFEVNKEKLLRILTE